MDKIAQLCYVLIFGFLLLSYAWAHDIYSGLLGKDHQLCCNGNAEGGDCASTIYRENGSHYEFLTRENTWVSIPEKRITFLPVPGDSDDSTINHSHLCYRMANETDRVNNPENVFGDIYFYCAFIPPTGY